MTWFLTAFAVFLLLWVGVGWLVLRAGSRARGGAYQRAAAPSIVAVDEPVDVTLRLVPPAGLRVADDHDVVLLLDHSGSMGAGPGSPLREAIRAAENFIRRLPPQIRVGIISFDDQASLICPVTDQHRRALRAVGAIGAGGGTEIHRALERAREALNTGRDGVKKTVILFSDGGSAYEPAVQAAEELRNHGANPTVLAVGFGMGVDEYLMKDVSGTREDPGSQRNDSMYYCHVSSADELKQLFEILAGWVSGQMAIAGLVDEGMGAPLPFTLARTGGLYPVGVQPGQPTRIVWSVPLMEAKAAPLEYQLRPICPGWHAVATPDSKADWRMPDGTRETTPGPNGPRVLVLPGWLIWAWWILNPLFWLIFGKLFCRPVEEPGVATTPGIPLTRRTLPAPLAAPTSRSYRARARPALVIGLGEFGEWTVCRLLHRAWDRGIQTGTVSGVNIEVVHHDNRTPVGAGLVQLDPSQRVQLHQDLRPYVETLRGVDPHPTRPWIPWQEWLADSRPLHTLRTLRDDRRMARLAILRRSVEAEGRLQPLVQAALRDEAQIFVVADAADAEGSGLLLEVAQMCASHGQSANAVLTASRRGERRHAGSRLAMALELERAVAMRGEDLISDRHEPAARAKRVLDRIVTLEADDESPASASRSVAELLWCLLAHDEAFHLLAPADFEEERARGVAVELHEQSLPRRTLWTWMRERTLAEVFNGQLLGLTSREGRFVAPAPDRESTDRWRERFWSGEGLTRTRSIFLAQTGSMVGKENPIAWLTELYTVLPTDEPYHRQVAYGDREREGLARYVEGWAQAMLDAEQDQGRWGVPLLRATVTRLEEDFEGVVEHIARHSGSEDFTNLIELASSLYQDHLSVLARLKSSLERWIDAFLREGGKVGPEGAPLRAGASYDIEHERQNADTALEASFQLGAEDRERSYQQWNDAFARTIPELTRFTLSENAQRLFEVRLQFIGRSIADHADVAGELRTALDPYAEIVYGLDMEACIRSEDVAGPSEWLTFGTYSSRAYGTVADRAATDDPFDVVAMRVRRESLRQSLGVESQVGEDLPFCWPEEANAQRIRRRIRNTLHREPKIFTPTMVHLMRDTRALLDFFSELARGLVTVDGTEFHLRRGGRTFALGTPEGLNPMERFESVVRQVASLRVASSGEPLPEGDGRWEIGEEAARQVEGHPLVKELIGNPRWAAWRDLIQGLLLEQPVLTASAGDPKSP